MGKFLEGIESKNLLLLQVLKHFPELLVSEVSAAWQRDGNVFVFTRHLHLVLDHFNASFERSLVLACMPNRDLSSILGRSL